MTQHNTINESLQDPVYRRKFEQEFLAFAATELICTLMKKQKSSRVDLAKKIGKSKAFVTQVLSGSRNMTMHTFADFAFALGHKVDLSLTPVGMTVEMTPHQFRTKPRVIQFKDMDSSLTAVHPAVYAYETYGYDMCPAA